MTKQTRLALLAVFIFVLVFFAVTGHLNNPYTAEEIETDLAGCIADCYEKEGLSAEAENISIVAICENSREKAFVFLKDGKLCSGFVVKSLLLPRYQMACGNISASGLLEEQEDFDLTGKQEFILKDFSQEQTYSYENGEFTLQSTENKMNEEVKNGIIRAACGVVFLGFIIFAKAKKSEEQK